LQGGLLIDLKTSVEGAFSTVTIMDIEQPTVVRQDVNIPRALKLPNQIVSKPEQSVSKPEGRRGEP
jgi:hypothetical protein